MQSFAVTTVTNQLAIKAGETRNVSFNISNISGETVRGRVRIVPEEEMPTEWLKLVEEQEEERDFPTDHNESYTVSITIPQGAAKAEHLFSLRVVNTKLDKIEEDYADSPPVAVSVEPYVRPPWIKWWMILIVVAVLLLIVGGVVAFLLTRNPELAITVSGPEEAVIAGTQMNYEITISNLGSAAAEGVILYDTLPGQVAFIASDQECVLEEDAANVLRCDIEGEVPADGEVNVVLQVDVSGTARDEIVNTVSMEYEGEEVSEAQVMTQVQPQVDFTLTASGPETVVADQLLRYEAQVTNNGPSSASNLTLSYQKPADVFEVAVVSGNSQCEDAGEQIHCGFGNLDSSEMVTMTVSILPGPETAEELVSAFAASSNELQEPLLSNSLVTAVTPATGLSLAFDAASGWAAQGNEFVFRILSRNNNANRSATGVELRSVLPESMDYLQSEPPCDLLTSGSEETLICELGDLNPEEGRAVDVTVLPNNSGTFDKVATISSTSTFFPEQTITEPTFVERSFASSGLIFDGKDDWVRLKDFNLPAAFTIEMWLNPKSTENQQSFIGKHTATGGNIFLLGYWEDGVHVNIRDSRHTGGSKQTGLQHMAVVVERVNPTNSLVTVYRNGDVLWSATLDAILGSNISGKEWVLGQDWDGNSPTDFYNGNMTEVRIWKGARSQEQIQEYMFRHLDGTEGDLIAYWPLNEGSGTTARDATGNGRDGQLMGNPCWVNGLVRCINFNTNVFTNGMIFELLPTPTPGP